MARVRVLPEANEQARGIDRWWRKNTSRPMLFAQEWNHAKKKLRVMPLIGPPVPDEPGVNHLLLRGCKHYVFYVYEPPPVDEVVIVEVRSNRQDSP